MNRLPCWLVRALAALAVVPSVHPAPAQEKSVRPGINKPFDNPDVQEYVGKFEAESREVYAQRRQIVAACKLRPGMAVADIGAGTGLFTRLFAPEVGPTGKVYAVDIAPKFVEHVEKTSKAQGLRNVVGVVCKPDSVELPPHSIDLAFICDTYHHFEFPARTMASVHRALRPGGRVVLIDFHRIEGQSSAWVLGHVRAGQEVFTREIVSAGFKVVGEQQFLKESYFVRVERVEAGGGQARPPIRKLGTLDLLMVETTPVVFKDRLYRFEYVRDSYPANQTGASYFRFIDVATGKATPAFAKGQHLGCAFVEGETVYAFGVDKWGGTKITVFRSKDMEKWEERLALHLPGWELFNTSVCKADGRYVMAVEVGGPKEVAGVPFTIFFAESQDLLTWKLLPQDCVYSNEKYTACPALRYLDGSFYMLYLEARPGPAYESHIVRSRDLKRWESSRLNPVLAFSDGDKAIANPKLTAEQRKAVAQARDINNSDVDLCEYRGRTVLYYSWGNQQGKEFLAEAVYDGTLADFLRSFFP